MVLLVGVTASKSLERADRALPRGLDKRETGLKACLVHLAASILAAAVSQGG